MILPCCFAGLLLLASPALAGQGQCIEGTCENGSGTYVLPDGTQYTGEFKEHGVAHGYGKIVYPSGSRFEGVFNNDAYDGYGTYSYKEGTYVGEFQFGKFQGLGTHVYKKGGVYVGYWQAGKYHGKGTYVYPTGKTYIGEWDNGQVIKKDNK